MRASAEVVLEPGFRHLLVNPPEDAGEKRAAWLAERLPDAFRDLEENDVMASFARFASTHTRDEVEAQLARENEIREELGFKPKDEEGHGP